MKVFHIISLRFYINSCCSKKSNFFLLQFLKWYHISYINSHKDLSNIVKVTTVNSALLPSRLSQNDAFQKIPLQWARFLKYHVIYRCNFCRLLKNVIFLGNFKNRTFQSKVCKNVYYALLSFLRASTALWYKLQKTGVLFKFLCT